MDLADSLEVNDHSLRSALQSPEKTKQAQRLPRLMQPKTTYTFDYPEAIKYAETQQSVSWNPFEIKVEKDVQDILVNMTPAESHGVITVLKLFTHYELKVGNEYWGGVVKKLFPRPDIGRMADCFTFFETNVHAPFYNKINEALYLATDEFFMSYKQDPILNDRIEFIDTALAIQNPEDPFEVLKSLGTFAMVEGAILYSNFAFLKHFQAVGKNKINNIVSGINFSVRDENIHHEGGAWLYRTLLAEANLTANQKTELTDFLVYTGEQLEKHEERINSMIFTHGEIPGIDQAKMDVFVHSRVNLSLNNLGIKIKDSVQKANPIADWFYRNINSAIIHDFFNRTGNQYHRNWTESAFVWKTKN